MTFSRLDTSVLLQRPGSRTCRKVRPQCAMDKTKLAARSGLRLSRSKTIREKVHESPFHACTRPSRSTRDPVFRLGWREPCHCTRTPSQLESESLEVQLGVDGGTVTLMTTADGGFTLDGEAFRRVVAREPIEIVPD